MAKVALKGTKVAQTKVALLKRAYDALAAGRQSFNDAAEALARARDLFGAKRPEMAKAVGMSETWVYRLLKWYDSGCGDDSPFDIVHKQERAKLLPRVTKAKGQRDDDMPDDDGEAGDAPEDDYEDDSDEDAEVDTHFDGPPAVTVDFVRIGKHACGVEDLDLTGVAVTREMRAVADDVIAIWTAIRKRIR